MKKKQFDDVSKFESYLKEINSIARLLEMDDLTIEESIKILERAHTLLKKCEEILKEAEKKIELFADFQNETNNVQ